MNNDTACSKVFSSITCLQGCTLAGGTGDVDRENRIVGTQRGKGGTDGKSSMEMCTLLHVGKETAGGDLLYDSGNSN